MYLFVEFKLISNITIPIPDKIVTQSHLVVPAPLQDAVAQYTDVEIRSRHYLYLRQFAIARLHLAAQLEKPIAVFRKYFGELSAEGKRTFEQISNRKTFNYEFVRYRFAMALYERLNPPTIFDYIGWGVKKIWGLFKPSPQQNVVVTSGKF